MTRVLHVMQTIDPKYGGPTAAFVGLTCAQAAAGLKVAALATFAAGADTSPAQTMEAAGVAVKLVGPAAPPLYTHPDLSAAVDAAVEAADVVHVHACWEQVQHVAARSAHRQGKPFVVSPHGMLTRWALARSRLRKWVYLRWRLAKTLRLASAVVFTSDLERRHTDRVTLPGRVIVEPIGVDLSEFDDLPPGDAFRAKHPAIGDRPVVAFLGRIYPAKGLDYLVPAVARLVGCGLDPVLLVIGPDGDAEYRRSVDAAVAANDLGGRTVFTGMLKGRDRVAALAAADVFCLPSDHENFGVSVVEALAAGLPVVLSHEVGVAPEVTAAGVGSAVERDPAAVADALAAWLTEDAMRSAVKTAGPAFVRERFGWPRIAERWAAHYESLVVARGPDR